MGGGLLSLTKAATAAAPEATSAIGRVLEGFVKPYRRSGPAVISDATGGLAAGYSVGSYDEFAPDAVKKKLGPLGERIAALAGGLSVSLRRYPPGLAPRVQQAVQRNMTRQMGLIRPGIVKDLGNSKAMFRANAVGKPAPTFRESIDAWLKKKYGLDQNDVLALTTPVRNARLQGVIAGEEGVRRRGP